MSRAICGLKWISMSWGNKNFKSPFSPKGKIRPNLLAVKHALSRSRIVELSGSARSAKFRGVLASWVN